MYLFSDIAVVGLPQSAVFTSFCLSVFISGKKNDELDLHNVDIVCGVVTLDIDLRDTTDQSSIM